MLEPTPEIQLVLLCSCIDPDEKRCARIRQAFCPSLDWEQIYSFSLRHRMIPIVYLSLKKAVPDLIPEKIIKDFRSIYVSNTRRNLSLTSFLLSIVSILNSQGIKVLPFKGPVLAENLYGDLSLRMFSDLDILVSQKDAVKAWHILEDNGWLPELLLDNGKKGKYIQTEDNLSFSSKGAGFTIELHWEMSGRYISPLLDLETIFNLLCPLSILNKKVLNLTPEILLLYLCIHGTKEEWWNLEQIFSISKLLEKEESFDWQLAKKLAQRLRCRRMLEVGLFLAYDIFSTPVPKDLIHQIKNNREILKITEIIRVNLFQKCPSPTLLPTSGRFSIIHLSVRDSFTEKLNYATRLFFSPTKKEWRYFPLPARLSFLHYGLRPFRLLTQGLAHKNA